MVAKHKLVPEIENELAKLSHQEIHFIYVSLATDNRINLIQTDFDFYSIHQKTQHITQKAYQLNIDDRAELLEKIKQYVKSIPDFTLDNLHFAWIDKKNIRQCLNVWLNILYILDEWRLSDPKYVKMHAYLDLQMPTQSVTTAEMCYRLILEFFGYWKTDSSTKLSLLRRLKEEWIGASKFKHKIFKHLSECNDETALWFYDYITKRHKEITLAHLYFQTFQQKSELILAIIDTWKIDYSEKTLTLDKCYTALYSKKYKEKSSTDEPERFYLNTQQVNKLEMLAKKYSKTKRQVLINLIDVSYKENFD